MAEGDGNEKGEVAALAKIEALRRKYKKTEGKDDQAEDDLTNHLKGITQTSCRCDEVEDDCMSNDEEERQPKDVSKSEEKSLKRAPPSTSPLHQAAERGDVAMVRDLLKQTRLGETSDVGARTPLHVAAGYGHSTVVEQLLQAGCDPLQQSATGGSALHEACRGGQADCLDLLVQHCSLLDHQDRQGLTPGHVAARQGELSCLRILHQAGASMVIRDDQGRQPCHLAAMRNHDKVVNFLYDCGVDLQAPDVNGKLPMHYAAQYGAMDCLTCLLGKDCDASMGDNSGNLAIHVAAGHDQLDSLRFLVKAGSSIDVTQGEGKTPLHLAAYHGSMRTTHWLLEKGANAGATDASLSTAAHYAAMGGRAKCLNCLLQHGASLTSHNQEGFTPLTLAKKYGHPVAVDRAAKNEITCDVCDKKNAHEDWRREHPLPAVVKSVNGLKSQAYTSPLPKQPRTYNTHKFKAAERANTTTRQAGIAQVNKPKRGGRGLGDVTQRGNPRGGMPTRDVAAQYFGQYVDINDMFPG